MDRKETLEEVGVILSVYCCLPREKGGRGVRVSGVAFSLFLFIISVIVIITIVIVIIISIIGNGASIKTIIGGGVISRITFTLLW